MNVHSASLRAHRGRGLMRYRVGRYDDSLSDLARARVLAGDDPALVADILLDEATVLDWTEDFRRSQTCVEEAQLLASGGTGRPVQEARLLLGLGRSAHRFSREEEARGLLERAVAAAEPLGDEGYETRVIALFMLGFVLPAIGRLAEGEAMLERAIAECRARGDRVHLFAALSSRALALGFRGATGAMVAELQALRDLARELGHVIMQLVAEFNLGEFLYLMGNVADARPHVRRAVELERRRHGAAARPFVALLEARVLAWLQDLGGARAILDDVAARLADARALGQVETLLVPSEEVQRDMVELLIQTAGAELWSEVEARAARFSVGQERIEVHEFHAIAALRAHRPDEARAAFERADALSADIPNVMAARLRRLRDDIERARPRTPREIE